MRRVALTLPTLLLLVFAALAPRSGSAFEAADIAAGAAGYQERLVTAAAADAEPASIKELQRLAAEAISAGQPIRAVAALEKAVAQQPGSYELWLDLAAAWEGRTFETRSNGPIAAAYNAYRLAADDRQRIEPLRLLALALERREMGEQAIAAYEELAKLDPDNRAHVETLDYLRRQYEFTIYESRVDTSRDAPQICVGFSDPLADPDVVRYADYIRIDPPVPFEALVGDQDICLEGVAYGQTYEVTVLAGLPSAEGERLKRDDVFTQTVTDREPSVGFRGRAYVLPQHGPGTVPLTTVNVGEVELRLVHINDRNLVEEIVQDRVGGVLTGYDLDEIVETSGALVWEGRMSVERQQNKSVVTGVPIGEILPERRPGVYILSARDADDSEDWDYEERGTQWLVVSDLGIVTFTGDEGLSVAVRSLVSAAPAPGVRLALLARNNAVLGEATTDEEGLASFPAGVIAGEGGNHPAAVLAYAGEDFNFQELIEPAFDLSDRGVSGRTDPGPIDAYLYTERGVYRPGETVQLTTLLRDDEARAVPGLPLTLKVVRPDGVEAERAVVEDQGGGSYHLPLALAATARTGTWTVEAYVDPEAEPVGAVQFAVEDFVPQRIRLGLTAAVPALVAGELAAVEVDAQFLYGAPAADLPGEAELILRPAANPFPEYAAYQFGLAQETFEPRRLPLTLAPTDAEGRSRIDALIDALPDTSLPLEAELRASIFDIGGRPVNESLVLPVRTEGPWIGIRAEDGEDVAEGSVATFEVIALDGDGNRIAADSLHYELVEEIYDYVWFAAGDVWDYRVTVRDRPVASGTVDVAADVPATIAEPVDWGRYRLDVYDPETNAASSVRFNAGWWVSPVVSDMPDKMEVTLDQASYRPGEMAQIHLASPFAGEVLLLVANDRVLAVRNVSVGEDGVTVELPVGEDWGVGAYVLATAFRPSGEDAGQMPARAVGVAHFSLDASQQTLAVAIDAPETVEPRQPVTVAVEVEGGTPGEPAWMTLAAVDEGILLLTDFASPDPTEFYFGKRALGLEMRDTYGRLILSEGRRGAIRTGGDGDQLRGLSARVVRTVSLFSGIVPVDAEGRAAVTLDIPDYNGELRLMAVAWTAGAVGAAERPLTVRDPVVAEVALPRFLAPDDTARVTVSLHNVGGAAGAYEARLATTGPIRFGEGADITVDLAADQRHQATLALTADAVGVGQVLLKLAGPNGFSVARSWDIEVRPAQAIATERLIGVLEPGERMTVDQAVLADYVPGTAAATLSLSTGPNFDVPGLLRQLDQYPYGCAEQITSRALPLLYVNDIAERLGDDFRADDVRRRVQGAIDRLINRQASDGSFGLWGPYEGDIWLSAYVMDFLTRAAERGYEVPSAALDRGIGFLQRHVNDWYTRDQCNPSAAYALQVLAQADAVDIADLRYYADNCLQRFRTPLAQGQIGAALAAFGDPQRADAAFETAAMTLRPDRPLQDVQFYDYGSQLRDRAALVALMAGSGQPLEEVFEQADLAFAEFVAEPWLSTQEMAWLVLAADSLLDRQEDVAVAIDGVPQPPTAEGVHLAPAGEALAQGIVVENQGGSAVRSVVAVRGVPAAVQPPESAGYSITRGFYDLAGNPIDPVAEPLRQNDLVVVMIEGESTTGLRQETLVVDLLPAGLEIENPNIGEGRGMEELLSRLELTPAEHVERRDDRFVAGMTLDEYNPRFAVAYLARAVTPGDFALPAAFVEDMYAPEYHARTELQRLTILPRK